MIVLKSAEWRKELIEIWSLYFSALDSSIATRISWATSNLLLSTSNRSATSSCWWIGSVRSGRASFNSATEAAWKIRSRSSSYCCTLTSSSSSLLSHSICLESESLCVNKYAKDYFKNLSFSLLPFCCCISYLQCNKFFLERRSPLWSKFKLLHCHRFRFSQMHELTLDLEFW